VSGFFLFLIAAFNVVILAGILRCSARCVRGLSDDETAEETLKQARLMNRFLGRGHAGSTRRGRCTRSLLFGLGFRHRDRGGPAVLAGTAVVKRRADLLRSNLVVPILLRRRDELFARSTAAS